MSTNYYWIGHRGDDSLAHHIGKRSAAGPYCWDCGVSSTVHTSELHNSRALRQQLCAGCGKPFDGELPPEHNASWVELGFARARDLPATGISGAFSFTWTMMKHKYALMMRQGNETPCVVNEYGKEFTALQFLNEELHGVVVEFQFSHNFF